MNIKENIYICDDGDDDDDDDDDHLSESKCHSGMLIAQATPN